MNYEYIRRLTKGISEDNRIDAVRKLSLAGIEVYEKTGTDAYRTIEGMQEVSAAEKVSASFETFDLYVSAADLEYARNCVTELGLQDVLCPLEESQVVKSAAEAAEEEYYKRRKIRLIECAVVILLGAAYMIYKSLAG